jgi:predicted Holliday junction resolvase-like endonuclease
VDFVVFDGLGDQEVVRIVLVEVKSGSDKRLSARQAQLRAAVATGTLAVEWRTLAMPKSPGQVRHGRRVPRRIELPPDSR